MTTEGHNRRRRKPFLAARVMRVKSPSLIKGPNLGASIRVVYYVLVLEGRWTDGHTVKTRGSRRARLTSKSH